MTDADKIHALIANYLRAYEAHDATGCAATYAEDALILSPWGPPARGRYAIAAAHLEWFEEGEQDKVMTIADLRISGALATCLVAYSADVPTDGGGLQKVHGASQNAFAQQPDGAWRITCTSLTELDAPLGDDK